MSRLFGFPIHFSVGERPILLGCVLDYGKPNLQEVLPTRRAAIVGLTHPLSSTCGIGVLGIHLLQRFQYCVNNVLGAAASANMLKRQVYAVLNRKSVVFSLAIFAKTIDIPPTYSQGGQCSS